MMFFLFRLVGVTFLDDDVLVGVTFLDDVFFPRHRFLMMFFLEYERRDNERRGIGIGGRSPPTERS